MNPDDITTETIMPEAFLELTREMVAQKSPEAAATAALAWALRHAPVDGGALEIAGHRIERIAPEPDPWPTETLIVADWTEGDESGRGLLMRGGGDEGGEYFNEHATLWQDSSTDTLTNVVPVTVVPVAGLEALRASIKALGYGTQGSIAASPGSLLDTSLRLLDATDALGVDL